MTPLRLIPTFGLSKTLCLRRAILPMSNVHAVRQWQEPKPNCPWRRVRRCRTRWQRRMRGGSDRRLSQDECAIASPIPPSAPISADEPRALSHTVHGVRAPVERINVLGKRVSPNFGLVTARALGTRAFPRRSQPTWIASGPTGVALEPSEHRRVVSTVAAELQHCPCVPTSRFVVGPHQRSAIQASGPKEPTLCSGSFHIARTSLSPERSISASYGKLALRGRSLTESEIGHELKQTAQDIMTHDDPSHKQSSLRLPSPLVQEYVQLYRNGLKWRPRQQGSEEFRGSKGQDGSTGRGLVQEPRQPSRGCPTDEGQAG